MLYFLTFGRAGNSIAGKLDIRSVGGSLNTTTSQAILLDLNPNTEIIIRATNKWKCY